MLHKTRAIALSHIKYRDTSIIAKIYTEEFGLQSYVANGVRSKNSRSKMALFQPFTLLELVCYHNEKKDIQRISEMKHAHLLHHLAHDVRKSSIALFLTEMLVKILREEQADADQFQFLYQSIIALDETSEGLNYFHLQFLLKWGRFLGITPDTGKELINEMAHYQNTFQTLDGEKFQELFEKDYGAGIVLTKPEKKFFLEAILAFYGLHFESVRNLKSLSVLQEVME